MEPTSPASTYVVAVRRDLRSQVGLDWAEPLEHVQGLAVVGNSNPYRLRIEATEGAIAIARQKLAAICHIEPVQRRFVL
jgi:hypothetical protein